MTTSLHDNQRIAKNTLLLSIRMVILMIISLYTSRVVLDQLGVVDFGVYNVVGGIVSMLSFLNSSMTTAIQRYFSYAIGEGDSKKLKDYFSVSIFAHVIIAIVIVVLVEFFGIWYLNNYMNIPPERMQAAKWVLQCSVVSTVFIVLQVPYNSMLIAKEQMSIYAYISIVDAVLKLAIVYVLSIVTWDKLQSYAFLMVIMPFVVLIMYHVYCTRKYEEASLRITRNWTNLKEIACFASWNVLGEISWLLTDQGVNLLINFFYGPVANTARAIGVQVNVTVNKFVQNFQMAVNPQVIKLYAVGDIAGMKKLVFQSSRLSYYLLFVLCFPLLFLMEDILAVWLKDVPEKAVVFCRLFLICSLVQIISNLLAQIAKAYGRIKKYTTMLTSTIFLIFPLSFVALYFGGDAELTVVIAILIQAIVVFVRMYLIKEMIGMRYIEFTKEVLWPIIKVTFISSLLPLIVYENFTPSIEKDIILLFMTIVCPLLSSYCFGMTSSEKDYVQKIFGRVVCLFFKK